MKNFKISSLCSITMILMAQEHIKSAFPFSPCRLTSYLILKNTNPNANKSGTNKLHCKKYSYFTMPFTTGPFMFIITHVA